MTTQATLAANRFFLTTNLEDMKIADCDIKTHVDVMFCVLMTTRQIVSICDGKMPAFWNFTDACRILDMAKNPQSIWYLRDIQRTLNTIIRDPRTAKMLYTPENNKVGPIDSQDASDVMARGGGVLQMNNLQAIDLRISEICALLTLETLGIPRSK